MRRFHILCQMILMISFTLLMGGCGDESKSKDLSGWAVSGGAPVGGYGVIIHTADDGKTWERQGNSEMIPSVTIDDVSAIDDMNAWVVGSSSEVNGTRYGTILRTTDRGKSWIRQGLASGIPDVELSSISAADNDVAWAVGWSGVVLNTTDGGATWEQQAQGLYPDIEFESVYAYDQNTVWAVGGSHQQDQIIIHTVDGGKTWVRQVDSGHALIDVHAYDSDTAWAVGRQGTILRTTDGGESWIDKASGTSPFFDFNAICAIDDQKAWMTTDSIIYYTDDGGDTWVDRGPVHLGADPGYVYYMGVTAADEKKVWVVTVNTGADQKGSIFHTEDGGETWSKQSPNVNSNLRGVSFVGACR